ncbi:hypothetical protein Droror1_Dr00013774 [Drosera rotundifolia]
MAASIKLHWLCLVMLAMAFYACHERTLGACLVVSIENNGVSSEVDSYNGDDNSAGLMMEAKMAKQHESVNNSVSETVRESDDIILLSKRIKPSSGPSREHN